MSTAARIRMSPRYPAPRETRGPGSEGSKTAEAGLLRLELLESLAQTLDLAALLLNQLVQSLDRSQRDAIRIDRRDAGFRRSEAERRLEVLRHRADVTDGRILLVAPLADRQAG